MTSSFEKRTWINGGLLRQYGGKNVSIMLRIEDESGSNLTGVSTDNQKIRVNLREPLDGRPGNWVEIIGTPAGNDAIRAKEAIVFPEADVEFDEEAYNMMVQFLNNCPDIFKQG